MYGISRMLPKTQSLLQRHERDCGLVVFSALAGVSREDLCTDLPDAPLGLVSVDRWEAWLQSKGFEVLRRDGCPEDVVPCAHLVGPDNPGANHDSHWVYRDADGDIHDPSPVFQAMAADDPRIRNLSHYGMKLLTISLAKRDQAALGMPNPLASTRLQASRMEQESSRANVPVATEGRAIDG